MSGRTKSHLVERLHSAEQELLTGWQAGEDEVLVTALAQAKVTAADLQYRVLELEDTLRRRDAELAALRAALPGMQAVRPGTMVAPASGQPHATPPLSRLPPDSDI